MKRAPPSEASLGLEYFLTDTPGTGGEIRTRAEDFRVEEIPHVPAIAQAGGKYTVVQLTAKNWETNKLVMEVASRLGIRRSEVHFAGTKDKRAITTQQMAIKAPLDKVGALVIPDVEIRGAFRADFAPKIGDLAGNRFVIRIRGFSDSRGSTLQKVNDTWDSIATIGGFPNYFGLQRFGTLRPITHLVGERILRGDFEGAVMGYVAEPVAGEAPLSYGARERLGRERDFERALEYYPQGLEFERAMISFLAHDPANWTGALRVLPRNLRTMFIYAYQSLLFNRIVSARVARSLPLNEPLVGDLIAPADADGRPDVDNLIPVAGANLERCRGSVGVGEGFVTGLLYGYDAPFAGGVMGEIEREVAASSGLANGDFRVPAMPEIRSFGVRRCVLAPVFDFSASEGADEAGDFVEVRFALAKGSYATCLLREIVKS